MERITLIESVLGELEQRNIAYGVLRNYDFLLERRTELRPSEKSMDVVVSHADFSRFEGTMKEFQFQKRTPQFSRKHHAYFHIIEGGDVVSFDVQVGGVYWNDMQYMDEKAILGNRIKRAFLYVPNDNNTFVMLLVHSILGKRYFKPEYREQLQKLFSRISKEHVQDKLKGIFTSGTATELLDLVSKNYFDAIIHRKNKYILTFLLRKQRLLTFLPLVFRWLKWKRFLQPYPLISIIGPDGAGKSTLAAALAEYLRGHHRKVEVIYTGRGRNQLLPFGTLGRKYKAKEKLQDGLTKPKRWKRRLIYTCAAPIFALDLWLRYWLHIFPARLHRKIVITDRYGSDIVLMKHVSLRFKQFLLWFFPTPTMTFYLYNTPKILHQRREEEPVEELERQLQLFETFVQEFHAEKIKTTDVETVQQQVFSTVISYLYREWY